MEALKRKLRAEAARSGPMLKSDYEIGKQDGRIEFAQECLALLTQGETREAADPLRTEYNKIWQFGPLFAYARTRRVFPFSENQTKYRVGNVDLKVGPGDGHTFYFNETIEWCLPEQAYAALQDAVRKVASTLTPAEGIEIQ